MWEWLSSLFDFAEPAIDPAISYGADFGGAATNLAGAAGGVGNYLGNVNISDALQAMNALGQLGNIGTNIYQAANMPKMPQGQFTGMYPQESLGLAGNEALSPALRSRKRMAISKPDLQAQLGGATISPALMELMGTEQNPLGGF